MPWAEISNSMPGRTANQVKNRWNATLSRCIKVAHSSTESSMAHSSSTESSTAASCTYNMAQPAKRARKNSHSSSTEAVVQRAASSSVPPSHPAATTQASKAGGIDMDDRACGQAHEQCVLCHALARFRCSVCESTFYCSSQCQHADWQRHKQECGRLKASNMNTRVATPVTATAT